MPGQIQSHLTAGDVWWSVTSDTCWQPRSSLSLDVLSWFCVVSVSFGLWVGFIWQVGSFWRCLMFLLYLPRSSLWVFSTKLPKRPCSRLELLSACLRYFLVSVYSQFGADVFVNVGEFLCEACVELFFENHTGVLVSQLIYVFCNIHQTLLLFWLLPLIPRFKVLNLVCCVLGEFFSPRLGGSLS